MKELTAAQIAATCGGAVIAGNPTCRFETAIVDSRQARPGALFFALPGARVDGHDFVQRAIDAGASGAVVTRTVQLTAPGVTLIQVDDANAALQTLASSWRDSLGAAVIGVAGSNGKTTTKEAVAHVLATAKRVYATHGNENSQIGAPLTILAAPRDTEALVLELGTSAPGELKRLAQIARPDHAIVTAAFAEHLEWLGDVDGVVAAETEILDELAPGSLALVGSAEPRLVAAARKRTHLRLRSIGQASDDDLRIEDLTTDRGGTHFTLRDTAANGDPRSASHRWSVPLLGSPAAWAAAFAVTLGRELAIDDERIQAGLDRLRPVAHRLAPWSHPRLPLFVVDDCYNSNPASCLAALSTASALSGADRLIVVVGDMLELGAATEESHREVGEALPEHAPNARLVLTVGPASRITAAAVRARGLPVLEAADADEAVRRLTPLLADEEPTTVLVKASRGIGLDRVVDAIAAL